MSEYPSNFEQTLLHYTTLLELTSDKFNYIVVLSSFMFIKEFDSLDPDEIDLKIEGNNKRAKIAEIRMNTIITGLKCGLPPKIAYKISLDKDLSKVDLDEIDKTRTLKP